MNKLAYIFADIFHQPPLRANNGSPKQLINIQDKTKKMALLSSLEQIAAIESGSRTQAFMQEFLKLVLGTISLPFYLPDTNYRSGVTARKKVVSMLEKLIEGRRASQESQHDMLGQLIRNEEGRHKLSDEEIIDQVITILYSVYKTISTTYMMAVKYLHDHPHVLQELKKRAFGN